MISIIVPVYNTAKYLSECLDSILNQTYADIEVILVDDGSTDNSLEICQDYQKKDERVQVYHQENSGVSAARNFGLDCARGEYISFCDSDDKIAPELYQILYSTMQKYDVDRVVSGYTYLFDDGRTLYSKPRIQDGKYTSSDILKKTIDDGTLSGFLFSGVNNSLHKKKIIDEHNLRFDSNIKYNEDSLFSFQYMLHSRSIYSLQSKPTYFYRQHGTSATHKRTAGDRYVLLRKKLWDMDLEHMDIDFGLQMKRRTVTEALWLILDIAKCESGLRAIRDIRTVLNNEALRKNISVIHTEDLNVYKRFYYILMKTKMSSLLYFSSSKLLPFLSKYISR